MFRKLSAKIKSIPEGVKASVAYTACSILQRCLSMVTMPLFTRILTQEQYGQFTLYTTWMNILTIFITLNLAYGSFPKAMVRFEKDRTGYVAAVQNITVLLGGIFLLLYLPLQNLWNPILDLPTPIVLLMVGEMIFQCALLCWYGQRRFENKYKSVVFVTLAVAVTAPLLAFILVSCSEDKGYARIMGYSFVNIAVGLIFFVTALIRGKGGVKKEYWKYALCFNIPLIPYYLSQVVFNQSDIIMIEHLSGAHSTDNVAMYGVAYNLATLMTFVLNSINGSYVPWFYGKIKEKKGEDNRPLANSIAILMAFLLLAVIAVAPELINILAADGYEAAVWVVPPVAMSILLLFYAQLFINLEFYFERKTMLVWGSIGSAVINIVLNWLLIPVFGFVAAGYTTLASYIVFAVANYIAVRVIAKQEEQSLDFFDIKTLILIFVIFAALSFLAMALYILFWIRWSIIAAVLLALVIFHKKVIAFVKSVLVRK
ncbi:MAG: oligosaccharide flippase family protein [Oscillospiraceae bacterium]|nr:oligosaccharide flippase family protein [Oscillospiraceae bacterium]